MFRRSLTALLFCSALAFAACGDESRPPSGACDSAADCAGGAECIEGVCVSGDAGADAPVDTADDADDASADAPADTGDDVDDAAGDAAADTTTDAVGDGSDTSTGDVEDEEVVEYPPLAFVTDPSEGDTFVPLDVTVSVRFNQTMNALRFIPSNVTLRARHGDPIPRVLAYDPDTYELTVAPPDADSNLRPVTPYEFRMAALIASVSGEDLGDPFRLTFSTTGYPGRPFLRQLATAYAPVVYQQVEEATIDTFARIDFDGNLTPADNLDNAVGANYGYIYYDVIESVTHWFISYLIYYPGSIPRDGVTYEHDILTVQVVVKKESDAPLGRLRSFSTFYHENLLLWTVETGWYSEGDAPTGNDESIDGRLPTERLEDDRHVSIFIESGRHTACLPDTSTTIPPCSPHGGDTAPFDPEAIGLVYRVAEEAQRIGDAPDLELTYSLRSFVEEFWALRDRVDGDDAVYGGEYEYRPPVINAEADEVRPGTGEYFPTALDADNADGHWGDLPFIYNATRERTDQGVWFVDPAWASNMLFTFPESFSPDYCFNPYLDIDVRDELRGCTPSDFVIE